MDRLKKRKPDPKEEYYEIRMGLGKVNSHSPEGVNPRTASDCLNALPLVNGKLDKLSKRKGFALAVNAPGTGKITCLFGFETPSATQELITTLTGLYKRNGTGTTAIKTDFTSSVVYNIVNYNELAIVCNGIDVIQKYDGTNISALGGTPPVGSIAAVIHDRLWVVGVTGNENIVYFSGWADPETWPAANLFNIYTEDGDTIQSIAGHHGQPTFLKKNSLHVLYGSDEDSYTLQRKEQAKGTISHRSVQVLAEQSLLVRLAADLRVWAWSGVKDVCISEGIDFGINSTYAYKAQSWVDGKGFYWLAVPTGVSTECNSIFVCAYDREQGFQWYPVTVPWTLNAFGWFSSALTLGRVDGVIDIEQAAYNDENALIDAYWESQYLGGKIDEYFKQFTTLSISAEPVTGGTITASWTDETGAVDSESVDVDTTDVIVNEILYAQTFAKHLKIKVRNSVLNKGMTIYSISGKYAQKNFG